MDTDGDLAPDREKRFDPMRRSIGVRPDRLTAMPLADVAVVDVDIPRGLVRATVHTLGACTELELAGDVLSEEGSTRPAHKASGGWSDALGPQSKSSAI